MIHHGACHCGNVKVAFQSNQDIGDMAVRACSCGFCRKHGARTWTDPQGNLKIFYNETGIQHYRFELKTADFLICKTCGLYIAAIIDIEGGLKATLNINLLDNAARFDQPAAAAHYGGETAVERLARRSQNWTPTEMINTQA